MVKRRFLCSLLCFPLLCGFGACGSEHQICGSECDVRLVRSQDSLIRSEKSLARSYDSLIRSSECWFQDRDSFENPPVFPLALMRFFRKPTSPPLPLREGPPLISVFSPQGRRGNRSCSSLVTISFYGWRTIRGLRQQRSCILRYATAWTHFA